MLLYVQVYVQDLIQANGPKLWPLFEAGAVVYICGDARRMVRLRQHVPSHAPACRAMHPVLADATTCHALHAMLRLPGLAVPCKLCPSGLGPITSTAGSL